MLSLPDSNVRYAELSTSFSPSPELIEFQKRMDNNMKPVQQSCPLQRSNKPIPPSTVNGTLPSQIGPIAKPFVSISTPNPVSTQTKPTFFDNFDDMDVLPPKYDEIINQELKENNGEKLSESFHGHHYQSSCISMSLLFAILLIIVCYSFKK